MIIDIVEMGALKNTGLHYLLEGDMWKASLALQSPDAHGQHQGSNEAEGWLAHPLKAELMAGVT